MRKFLLLLLLAILACSCSIFADSTSPRKIIIDTDTGADDASALILAECSPEVEILGVTVQAGNVSLEQGTLNALASLELAGCDVPVYKGSDTRYDGTKINPHSVFGEDGMGDKDLIHVKGEAQEGDAIDFILDTVRSNPGEIEIVMLGPATNIARAIDRDPDTMRQLKCIWSMGTPGLYGSGNASPVSEFNVFLDAPAYSRLLNFDVPLNVVGLDVCDYESKWRDDQFEKLAGFGEIGRFVVDSFSVLREYYAKNGSADSVMNCDATAMLCVVCPDFIQDEKKCHCSCICDSGETYGQVIFYKEGFTYDMIGDDINYNVNVVCEVNRSECFTEYLARIGRFMLEDKEKDAD